MNPMLGSPFDSLVARRRREVTARVDELRDRALDLERQAVVDRVRTWSSMGTYEQMLRETGADDLEKKAMRLRRSAAELEMTLR
ncbi:hypothetical protein [Gordonia desulfuricans]|uniref:hypothetical protein n=1 Tax=Gordonia desulfuricans TaxID=89051 RepID=UPI001EE45A9F|nr:hypothetical protein [Gordonia desulfuricans]